MMNSFRKICKNIIIIVTKLESLLTPKWIKNQFNGPNQVFKWSFNPNHTCTYGKNILRNTTPWNFPELYLNMILACYKTENLVFPKKHF